MERKNVVTGYLMTLPEAITTAFREHLLNTIDPVKRRRLRQFIRLADLDRSLIADAAIRYFAMRRHGWRNRDIQFSTEAHGKPFFIKPIMTEQPPFHFNISHSGCCILCAVSDSPVGCDIEAIEDVHDELIDLVFAPEEIHALKEMEEEGRAALFYWLWTRKESFIKATGAGLLNELRHYSVMEERVIPGESWRLRSYRAAEGYALALCTANDEFPRAIEHVDTMILLQQYLAMAENERI
jgi:4'-phosphopantetheinyl transferase